MDKINGTMRLETQESRHHKTTKTPKKGAVSTNPKLHMITLSHLVRSTTIKNDYRQIWWKKNTHTMSPDHIAGRV